MAQEIERKYLLKNEDWRQLPAHVWHMQQGYLSKQGNTVRIRIANDKAFLTVKSKSKGLSRLEFEYEVPVADAQHMMLICITPVVEKFRHCINYEGHVWEVDEFKGENEGLVVAEVEMRSEDEAVSIPTWIGSDVSDDKRYRNSRLAICPFKSWK